ncbi:MAG: S-adenosylmethionine--2-demethylmenaquinone methyltransferase [Pseudomonadota bacterium]
MPITVPVADICDAHRGRVRVLDADWRAFTTVAKFAGPARLVALHAADRVLSDMLKEPGDGAVALATVTGRNAVFGDGMATNAEANGWAGVVIEGAVCDVALIRPRQVGVRALRSHPMFERAGPEGDEVAEMSVAGVWVRKGDWIIADEDGVIAVDADLAANLRAP